MSDTHTPDAPASALNAAQVLARLSEPFPSSEISWRASPVSGQDYGRALPFLDARNVQDRLDAVLGLDGWRDEYVEVSSGSKVVAVRCKLSVRVQGAWVTKEDAAPMDMSGNLELGIKGAYSDALKRAAVKFGIGRYLYALRAPLVALDKGQYLPDDFDGRLHLTVDMVPANEREELQQLLAQAVSLTEPDKAAPAQAVQEQVPAQEQAPAEQPPSEAESKQVAPAPTPEQASAPEKEEGEAVRQSAAAAAAPAKSGTPDSDDQALLAGIKEKIAAGVALLPLKAYLASAKVKARLTEKTRNELLDEVEKKLK